MHLASYYVIQLIPKKTEKIDFPQIVIMMGLTETITLN